MSRTRSRTETGRLLREAREQAGLSLHRFSERLPGRYGTGLDPSDLNKMENGRKPVTVRAAAEIERALGMPVGSLLAPAVVEAAGAPLTHAILHRFIETAPRDRLEELRRRVDERLGRR